MAFAKTSKSERFDFGDQEVVASNFTLTDGTQVSSAAKGAAIAALTSQAASTVAADFAGVKVQIDAVITKLNAVIAALKA